MLTLFWMFTPNAFHISQWSCWPPLLPLQIKMEMSTWCVLWPRLRFFWLFILYYCSLGHCRHCSILLGRSVIMQDQLCSLQAKVDCKSIFCIINCWGTVTLTGTEFQVEYGIEYSVEYAVFLPQYFLAFSETWWGLVQAVGNTQGLLRVHPFSRYLPYLYLSLL